jgi:hypothetical protein
MSTRYTALSTEQKLALTSEELDTAIQLEAAERGIPIPIAFSDAVNQMGYVGYTIPQDAASFYEIMTPCRHSGHSRSGVCFKTEADAIKSLEGAVAIVEEGYGTTARNVCAGGEFVVQKVYLTHSKGKSLIQGIQQYEEDREPYQKLCDELHGDLMTIRQEAYNAKVIAEKRAKYLALANGDESTAERFWNNLEKGEWKSEAVAPAVEPELEGIS